MDASIREGVFARLEGVAQKALEMAATPDGIKRRVLNVGRGSESSSRASALLVLDGAYFPGVWDYRAA